MPITLIDAPVTPLRVTVHQSAHVCAPVTPEPVYDWNLHPVPDWLPMISLDRQAHRDKLENAKRQRMANTAALMRQKESDNMPFRMIDEQDRKPRTSLTGKFSQIAEVVELWQQPKLPQGKAYEVSVPPATIEALKKDGVKKPIRAIVNALRRKIKADGLSFDVYSNDEHSFTVMRGTAPTRTTNGTKTDSKKGK